MNKKRKSYISGCEISVVESVNLSFGNKVKILGPPEMVELMKSTLDSIKNLYES